MLFRSQVVLEEFANVEFSGQKSIALESIVADTKIRVQQFPHRYTETTKLLVGEVTKQINDRIEFLSRDNGWANDSNQLPYIIGKKEIDGFSQQIEDLKPLFDDPHTSLETVLSAFSKLFEENQNRKLARSKQIKMKPEALTDPDAIEPKTAALNALNNKIPEARVLKVAVVKPWESKRVEEWADSTKTQWIVKNISETNVQVVAELPDGEHKLFTLHVEKNLNPNGLYGTPTSHIMFDELMAKENI